MGFAVLNPSYLPWIAGLWLSAAKSSPLRERACLAAGITGPVLGISTEPDPTSSGCPLNVYVRAIGD